MLWALAVSFAMLTVNPAPGAAETTRRQSSFATTFAATFQDVAAQSPAATRGQAGSSGEDSAAENELLASANKSRELAGAPPLRMDESLREAARAHARRMVDSERLDHQFSGELSLLERVAQVSALNTSLKIDRAGENVAYAPALRTCMKL